MIATIYDYVDAFHGAFNYEVSSGLNEIFTYIENFTVVTKGQERLYT